MKQFKVTKKIMEKAQIYMPSAQKVYLAKQIAKNCLEPVENEIQKGINSITLPPLVEVNLIIKRINELQIMLGFYLDVETPEKFTEADYDFYHTVFGQVRGYYEDDSLREKAMDIMQDFHEFCNFVDNEIEKLKLSQNDMLNRFTRTIQLFSSPEATQKLLKELKDVTKKYEQAKNKVEENENEKQGKDKSNG